MREPEGAVLTITDDRKKKATKHLETIEQCGTYIRFQTIILNKVMSNSVTFQHSKRALTAKMILQLTPSCY